MPRNPARVNKTDRDGDFTGRIGAGVWRGRTIDLIKNPDVRPTRDRVRQAAFNLLTSRIDFEGAVVFDLCCGSGAYGLEALSRGAAEAYLVDLDVRVATTNVAKLKAAHAHVVVHDVQSWEPPVAADIIFLDPPYHNDLVRPVWGLRAKLADPETWWVIELPADNADLSHLLPHMDVVADRVYGVTRVVLGRCMPT